MRRPQSTEGVSLKTVLVMLVFLKVSREVSGCSNDVSNIGDISTSEITILGASNCTVPTDLNLSTPVGNDLIVRDLQPGTSYNLTVNCSHEYCIQFTTKPDVIRNLSVTLITTTSVSLNWTEPQGNSLFYRVEWDEGAVPMNKTTYRTSVDITGLTAGVQYVFSVVAVAADSQTAGDPVSKTQYTRPDVIRNLSVTLIATTSVSLSWTEPQGNSLFYRVEWYEGAVPMNKTTNPTSVDVTGLTAGVQYVFSVVAVAADSQTAGDPVSKTQYTRPDVIRNLSVTQITTTSVSLNWTEPQGNSLFYRVEWYEGTVPMDKTTNRTSVDITGLTAGVQYVFSVVAVAADSQIAGNSVNKTQYTRPDVIRNLSVTQITTTSVSLNWTEPQGNSLFYRVEWYEGTVPMDKTTNRTSVDITGLTAGVQYVFSVVAVAADSQIAGNSVNKTQYTRPDVIRNLSVTQITTTSVSLNWTEPQGNSLFYRVEWYEGTVPMDKTTNRTSVDITGLTAGVQYVFSVVAVAADSQIAGNSVNKTQYTRPDVIRNLSVTQITTTSVSLNWTEPQGNSLFYRVEWYEGTVPMDKTTNRTSVDITGLTAGVQYVFSVVAVAADSQIAGNSVNKTQYTRPDVIRNLSVTQITTTSVSLNWTEPQGNSLFYRVEWYEGTVPMDKTTNRTSVDITGLTAGVQYVFSVVAVAADSQIAGNSVNKTQYTRPDVIRNLSVTQITTTSVSLNWTEPQGNSLFYRVEWYEGTVPMNKTTNRMSVDITGLTAGVQYVFSVVVVAADSQTAGDSVNKTQYTRPDVIRNLSVTLITTTSVSLNWTEPQGNSLFYRVDWDVGAVPMNKTTIRTSVDITGLTAGVQYVFSVVAVAADSQTVGDSVNKTQYTRPDVIRNLSVTQITTTSVSLNWTEPQGNSLFYRVDWDVDTVPMNTTTNRTSVEITGLTAGVQYVFSVVAVAADSQTEGDSVNKTQYTKPDVIRNLSFTQITTTSVSLNWTEPQGNSLFYRVEWDEGAVPMNKTTNRTSVDITGLTAGVQYVFSVVAVAADCQTAGDSVNKTQYTRPEKAVNVTQTRQTNHSLDVAWSLQGNATSYEVHLTNSTLQFQQNTTARNASFTGLSPGIIYNVTVTAAAGPFESTSDTFPFATNPNPPEAIKVQEQTTSSIKISWDGPLGMDRGQYNFTVLLSDLQLMTAHNWALVGNRTSGTQYNISVATVGPLGYQSMPVTILATTRPLAVSQLQGIEVTTSKVTLSWEQPEPKDDYTYYVMVTYSNGTLGNRTAYNTNVTIEGLQSEYNHTFTVTTLTADKTTGSPRSISLFTRPEGVRSLRVNSTSAEEITLQWEANSYRYRVVTENYTNYTHLTHHQVGNLSPGTRYTFNVTTFASDGTEGSQRSVTSCTDAAPVTVLNCTGPDLTGPKLLLSWREPRGANRGFEVHPNKSSPIQCNSVCSHNLTGLSYNTEYTVMVWTLGCGEKSVVTQEVCKTGITVPPAPVVADVSVAGVEGDRFTLQLGPGLFSNINGPIVNYGVLVTTDRQSLSGKNESLGNYLTKTYEDWTAGSTTTYLAVIKEAKSSNRNGGNSLVVVVGDGTKLHSYNNGPLSASSYSFAVVTFTRLELNKGFVSIGKSFFSISQFYHEVILISVNSAVIGGAVGGSLAALFILTLVVVIATVFWKRRSKEKSSDVPIYSIRAEVNTPIRVENYETYYRENQADSNCGFAEQFENLKPVGKAQSVSIAMSPENKGKNRYNNVLPCESAEPNLWLYRTAKCSVLNAQCKIKQGYNSRKEFIAAQGPLPNTVSEFWRMIWEKNVHTLVMLTRCNELGRVKCEEYWPSGSQNYDNIAVRTTSEIPLEDWTIRDFSIKNVKTSETRTVRHFHFTAWPDHGVPETTELLINFRHLVREHMDQYSQNSPTVVHCSAGVGRTGTFIAIDRLIFQIERDSVVDVFGVIHDLRMHRTLMVQTEDQYVFLSQCAMDVIRSRTGTNVDLIYQNTAALSIYENFEPMKSQNGYHNA